MSEKFAILQRWFSALLISLLLCGSLSGCRYQVGEASKWIGEAKEHRRRVEKIHRKIGSLMKFENLNEENVDELRSNLRKCTDLIVEAKMSLRMAVENLKKTKKLRLPKNQRRQVSLLLESYQSRLEYFQTMEKLYTAFDEILSVLPSISTGLAKLEEASGSFDTVTKHSNAKNWKEALTCAQRSQQLFDDALQQFSIANEKMEGINLDTLLQQINRLKEAARLMGELAQANEAGDEARIRDMALKLEILSKELTEFKRLDVEDVGLWINHQVEPFLKEMERHARKADYLEEEAKNVD
ncbi:MAG: hypothetical protein QMD66_04830 [Actinomycetota bacterium]|nr:hypothetical protein [Actinomycetota bacterium]MDI6822175.1 hypothetical protein [Actinomycetota bacterium]